MKLLYVHGLNGSKNSKTVAALQKALGDGYEVLAETFDYSDPVSALSAVADFWAAHYIDAPIMIGNSLGGFYANEICKRYNAPVVLINPSLFPERNLVGRVDASILEEYEAIRAPLDFSRNPRLVMYGTEDKVVDPWMNALTLKHAELVVFEGMGHELTMYDVAAKCIAQFANQVQGT